MTTVPSETPSLKVMVVDDDPIIVRILERLLRRRNVDVITTHRAFGVLNLIALHRPAIVLLDVNLPALDGPSLVKLIRGDVQLHRTTVLLHSALGEAALAQSARKCGANGFIAKSLGMANLEENLDRWLASVQP
jgi:CheY-like chemotaxis protein